MGYCSFGFEARASSFATFRRFYSSLARIAHRPTRRRQQEAPRPHTATSHQRDGAPPPWPSPSPPTPPRQPIHVVRVRAHRATNARVRRRSVRARPHTCSTPTHPPTHPFPFLRPPARPAAGRALLGGRHDHVLLGAERRRARLRGLLRRARRARRLRRLCGRALGRRARPRARLRRRLPRQPHRLPRADAAPLRAAEVRPSETDCDVRVTPPRKD